MADLKARTVLIVDDDDVIQRLLTTTLRFASLRVLQARTAPEGLRIAREMRPRLIFLDIRLGADDGLRICRMLKEDAETSTIRIVVLSAHDDPATRVRARLAGADRFFGKPFSPLALCAAVEELIGT